LSEIVRFGFIGCGYVATYYANAIKKMENAKIVAVSDIVEERAKAFRESSGAERHYLDNQRLVEDEDVDAVYIAIPHNMLKEESIRALKAGKHVLVEKPMAFNHFEAKEMINTAKKYGVKLMVDYNYRYKPVNRLMKDLLKKKTIGETSLIRACMEIGAYAPHVPRPWLYNPKYNRGMVHYVGCHLIDKVIWFADSDPTRVYGEVEMDPEHKTSNTEIFTIRFKNGVLASICTLEGKTSTVHYVRASSPLGYVASYEKMGNITNVVKVYSRKIEEYSNPTTLEMPNIDTASPVINEFIDSIMEDREPTISGKDGLKVIEVIDAIYQSNTLGKSISLPL
jgi:predicted dehydrogenase